MPSKKINTYFFLFLLLAISVAFIKIISPFLIDITVTAVLATIFNPVYKNFTEVLKNRRRLAALFSTLLVCLFIVIPVIIVGVLVANDAMAYFEYVRAKIAHLPDIREALAAIPFPASLQMELEKMDAPAKIIEFLNSLAKVVVPLTQNFIVNLGTMIFNFFIILILLYFIFLDGDVLLKKIRMVAPLKTGDQDLLISRFKSITDATVKGVLVIAVMEATVGGGILAIIHMPSPIIWGFIIMLLSILPLVGTKLVLIPIAIYKFAVGDIFAGVLLLCGIGFVLISQNIIKPALVGNRADLHPAFILVSTLGGLIWLGIIGVIVGPVIAAFFIAVWGLFESHFKTDLDETGALG